MRAVPGIYENGVVYFSFCEPRYEGPVRVMVVFPDDWEAVGVEDDDLLPPPDAFNRHILPDEVVGMLYI